MTQPVVTVPVSQLVQLYSNHSFQACLWNEQCHHYLPHKNPVPIAVCRALSLRMAWVMTVLYRIVTHTRIKVVSFSDACNALSSHNVYMYTQA